MFIIWFYLYGCTLTEFLFSWTILIPGSVGRVPLLFFMVCRSKIFLFLHCYSFNIFQCFMIRFVNIRGLWKLLLRLHIGKDERNFNFAINFEDILSTKTVAKSWIWMYRGHAGQSSLKWTIICFLSMEFCLWGSVFLKMFFDVCELFTTNKCSFALKWQQLYFLINWKA